MRRIARRIEINVSTVSREFMRNRSKRGYRPGSAHRQAMGRKRLPRKPRKLSPEVKQLIGILIFIHDIRYGMMV